MKLKVIDIVILLSLGILLITRSIWGFFKDIDMEISKAKAIYGKVSQADIRKIEESTFKAKKYKTVFAILLDNSREKFAVDRGASICTRLNSQIKVGDSIKIYYRSSTGDINTHVFQIEKDNFVIVNAENYRNNETSIIVLMAFLGVLITIGTIVWAVKQGKT